MIAQLKKNIFQQSPHLKTLRHQTEHGESDSKKEYQLSAETFY
jgi:hypothetical protein